jgi:hypothetical protein
MTRRRERRRAGENEDTSERTKARRPERRGVVEIEAVSQRTTLRRKRTRFRAHEAAPAGTDEVDAMAEGGGDGRDAGTGPSSQSSGCGCRIAQAKDDAPSSTLMAFGGIGLVGAFAPAPAQEELSAAGIEIPPDGRV